jgi:hypothetical protein
LEIAKDDDRNLRHPEFARGEETRMARDNDPIRSDKDRVNKSTLLNRSGDLSDLLIGMRASVPRVWDEMIDRPELNLQLSD